MKRAPAPREPCPICLSTDDLIINPYGVEIICDRPTCVYTRTLDKATVAAVAYERYWKVVLKVPA